MLMSDNALQHAHNTCTCNGMFISYVCRGVPCREPSQGLFTHAVWYIKQQCMSIAPLSRRTLDYQDVLGALNKKGIAIRVASPKLVMEEVSRFDAYA